MIPPGALGRLDAQGRFAPQDVALLREALRAGTDGFAVDHPRDLFGPWEALTPETRQRIRHLLAEEMRRAMDWYPRGALWPRTANLAARLAHGLDRPGSRGAARAFDALGTRLWSAPFVRRQRIVTAARARRWLRHGRPTLFHLLAFLGHAPEWLEGDWADAVPVDPRCQGLHHDPQRNVAVGHLVGIDLIPSPDGVWCIEANLNTSFAAVRRDVLNPEPSVPVLVAEARAMGASRIWWVEQDRAPAREWLLDELGAATASAGMTYEVLEDWRVAGVAARRPGMPPGRRYAHMELRPPPDTFVLRRNTMPLGPDRIIHNKDPFIRGLATELGASGDRRVRVPAMTRQPGPIGEVPPGLPNLVYKYPDMGKGEGVHFLRVRSPEQALSLARELDARHGEPPGLFQPFVCSRLLPGRRIYDVRCELLMSPFGVRHVFALRREATRPLPEGLDEGIAPGGGVFSSNVSTGGRFAPLDPAEAPEVLAAAEAVGEALGRLLTRAYAHGAASGKE